MAYFPLYGKPVDPRLVEAFERETDTFHKAAALYSPPIEVLEIPFEDGSLPAYLVKVDDSGKPRSTIIQTNGYDSNIYPRNIARKDHRATINATLEVDFLGQCASESLGSEYWSSSGGQLDFEAP